MGVRLLPVQMLLLVACADEGEKGGDSATTETGTPESGFDIQGTALLFEEDGAPAPEGSCVSVIDPRDITEGSGPPVLAETTVGAAGVFALDAVPVQEYPPLILLDECGATPPATIFATTSGLPPELIDGVGDGDVVSEAEIVALTLERLHALEVDLGIAGFSGDLGEEGLLVGFVRGADRQPLAGATIDCAGCTAWYGDEDDSDGLFTTGDATNTETSVTGFFVIPGAPLGGYSAVASGYTFMRLEIAALPRTASVINLVGEGG